MRFLQNNIDFPVERTSINSLVESIGEPDRIDNQSVLGKTGCSQKMAKSEFTAIDANLTLRPTVIILGSKQNGEKAVLLHDKAPPEDSIKAFIPVKKAKPVTEKPILTAIKTPQEANIMVEKAAMLVGKDLEQDSVRINKTARAGGNTIKTVSLLVKKANPSVEKVSTEAVAVEKANTASKTPEPDVRKGPEIIIFDGHLPSSYYAGYGLQGSALTFKRNGINSNGTLKQLLQQSVLNGEEKKSEPSINKSLLTPISEKSFTQIISKRGLGLVNNSSGVSKHPVSIPRRSTAVQQFPSGVQTQQGESLEHQNFKTSSLSSHIGHFFSKANVDSEAQSNSDEKNGKDSRLKNGDPLNHALDLEIGKPQNTIVISNPLKRKSTDKPQISKSFELSTPKKVRLSSEKPVKGLQSFVLVNRSNNEPKFSDMDPNGPTIVSVASLNESSEISTVKVTGFLGYNNRFVSRFECSQCDHVCQSQVILWHHIEEKHNKSTCDQCGKVFLSKDQLRSHSNVHRT